KLEEERKHKEAKREEARKEAAKREQEEKEKLKREQADKKAKADMVNSQDNAKTAALSFLRLHPEYGVTVKDLHVKNISFDVKKTGGPSGGMIFAIGVIELLTQKDLLQGRHIAGTGTITTDGKVGPIGGINQKILAAHKAGATLFIAPAGNRGDIANIPSGIKVVTVATLAEAIAAL
ncbi:MAG: hypothetical protein EBW99_05275, partial [Actinobacteria bacterium]|nr:hypothetical protein [Actinomycetota bacterium]